MIQLLHLRAFERDGKTHKYDTFIKDGFGAESVVELFKNLKTYTKEIPEKERWNCFYTLANCTAKKREFQSLSVIAFDIDGIDTEKTQAYLPVVCDALNVAQNQTGIVFSGNGLHFIIGLATPIVDKNFFRVAKDHYKALCGSINKALEKAELPGKTDPSIFDPRRIFRLPGTVNRKPGKKDKTAALLQGVIVPIPFDITLASGIPTVKKEEQVDPDYFKKFPKVDNEAVFKTCSFLAHAKDNAAEISEPQWYAALSITARMEDGRAVSHNLSQGHPAYSEAETDLKIEQATGASGPRTCKSISNLWSGCKSCPHFKNNTSPIMIRGEDTLKTEHTGFHDIVFDEETQKMKRGKPNFSDLRKFFERTHSYRAHDKVVWTWSGTHYKEITNEKVKGFAQQHFNPYATMMMRAEFLDLLQVTNTVEQEEWNRGTFAKINLLNGVLDLEKNELTPHSKEGGFKYVLPYGYDKKAKAPRFEKFLDEVTGGNQILKDTLLEFGGYALSGARCVFAKALVLEGEGSNGKSTFIDVLKAVAGKDSYSTLSFSDLNQMERRSALDGVLFNITEETPNKLFDTTSFKNLISGGDVQIRKLYKNAYSIQNKAKLVFSCNEMPTSTDASRGFFRRFLIIPFNVKFSRVDGTMDLHLYDKLVKELPGILNLFLEGYRRLLKNSGFSKKEEDDEELQEYREAVDPLLVWFKECVILSDPEGEKFVTATQLFESFRTWCEKNGFDARMKNAVSLGIALRRYLPDIKKRRTVKKIDGATHRHIVGISLKEIEF